MSVFDRKQNDKRERDSNRERHHQPEQSEKRRGLFSGLIDIGRSVIQDARDNVEQIGEKMTTGLSNELHTFIETVDQRAADAGTAAAKLGTQALRTQIGRDAAAVVGHVAESAVEAGAGFLERHDELQTAVLEGASEVIKQPGTGQVLEKARRVGAEIAHNSEAGAVLRRETLHCVIESILAATESRQEMEQILSDVMTEIAMLLPEQRVHLDELEGLLARVMRIEPETARQAISNAIEGPGGRDVTSTAATTALKTEPAQELVAEIVHNTDLPVTASDLALQAATENATAVKDIKKQVSQIVDRAKSNPEHRRIMIEVALTQGLTTALTFFEKIKDLTSHAIEAAKNFVSRSFSIFTRFRRKKHDLIKTMIQTTAPNAEQGPHTELTSAISTYEAFDQLQGHHD